LFEDRESALVISGWFEPEQAFSNMKQFWSEEQANLIKQGLKLQNIQLEQIGKWDVVLYDISLPGGRSSNMRAEWIQSGTWIDIHMSLTNVNSEAENRSALRDVVQKIVITEKTP
jgi:hypothetical protein